MNVLLLRSDVAFAGPGLLALRIGRALIEEGHAVRLATSGGEMVARFEEAGIPVDFVPELAIAARGVGATWRAMRRIRRLAVSHRIDVMHSFNAHAALAGELANRTTSARLVHTVLGTGKEWMNRLHGAPIAAVSRSTAGNLVRAGVSEKRIRVIPPLSVGEDYLLDDEELARVEAARSENLFCRFVSVAMFTGGKGHEQLIDRFARYLRTNAAPAELVLVGDGPSRAACEALAGQLGIADKVVFAGAQREVARFLDEADVFVHHAKAETFGMVFVEAGARALPSLAADVGGISDIVVDGETGLLVPFDAAEEFAAAMATLAADAGRRREMGRAARERMRARFVKEAILPRYLALYTGA